MSIFREKTPDRVTDDARAFASDLGLMPPVHVPVSPPPGGQSVDRLENLLQQSRLRHGELLFGRTISFAEGLYLVGEWHGIVSTPEGLIDVSHNPTGETRVLFAACPDPKNQTELFHPSIRARIYGAAERKDELEEKLLAAGTAETITAKKNGITVRQLLLSRLPRDQFAAQIDDYLRAEGILEAKVVVSAQNDPRNWDGSRVAGLREAYDKLDRQRERLFEAADLHLNSKGLRP